MLSVGVSGEISLLQYVAENYNNEQINLHVNYNNFLNDDFDRDYSANEDELYQEEVVRYVCYLYIEYIKNKKLHFFIIHFTLLISF